MEGRPELDHAFAKSLKAKTIAYCDFYTSLEVIQNITNTDGVELLHLSKAVFDDLTYQNVPGNFLVVFESWKNELSDLDPGKLTIMLESTEKPGNLGAILRTCDAMGVKQIVVSESEIDLFNPNVLRNSRGGLFNTSVVFCSNQEAFDWLEGNGIKTFAAVLSEKSVAYKTIDKSRIGALLFGSESSGLSEFWLQIDNIENVIIPMDGIVDSLNLSVSVAVLLAYFSD